MLFDTRQLETFGALCDTILPPDDFAGGLEAGAGDYVLSLLGSQDGAHFLPLYCDGLEKLDEEAQAHYRDSFAHCTDSQREALVTSLEAGKTETGWTNFKGVFQVWCNHFAEGYYNNPNYGGNRDYVSWKMIGFPIEASIHHYEQNFRIEQRD